MLGLEVEGHKYLPYSFTGDQRSQGKHDFSLPTVSLVYLNGASSLL